MSALLRHRPAEALSWIEHGAVLRGPLVVDANTIGHTLRGRAPRAVIAALAAMECWLSAPTVAELERLAAQLDPDHPQTMTAVAVLRAALARHGPERTLVPTREDWIAAARLAGQIARHRDGPARRMNAGERIELLDDCLTAEVAIGIAGTVLTNDLDFDLIQQSRPELRVVFFRQGRR